MIGSPSELECQPVLATSFTPRNMLTYKRSYITATNLIITIVTVDCLADENMKRMCPPHQKYSRKHEVPPVQEIPPVSHLMSRRFRLADEVAHLPGHYVAYVKRSYGWELFNDLTLDERRPIKCSDNELIAHHILVYTV